MLHLHEVGKGCPDLLVWHRGRYVLMECKVPGETINKLQAEFIATCPGQIEVVRSPAEAIYSLMRCAHCSTPETCQASGCIL